MPSLEVVHEGPDGRILATERGRRVLSQTALGTLDEVRAFQGGLIVAIGRRRTVRRLESPNGPVFLKQARSAGVKPVLAAFLGSGRRRSSAAVEAGNASKLVAAGVAVPEVLAYGEAFNGLSESYSFLLTAAAPGFTLSDYLYGRPGAEPRSRANDEAIRESIEELLRRLIRVGLFPVDLAAKHVFLSRRADRVSFSTTLIDVARLSTTLRRPADAARVVARMGVEIPFFAFSQADRRRALRRVLGPDFETLVDRVSLFKGEYLEKRRFRRYFCRTLNRPTPPPMARFADGAVVAETAFAQRIVAAGLSLDAPLQIPSALRSVPIEGVEIWEADGREIRVLCDATDAILDWHGAAEIVARHIPAGIEGTGWVARRRVDGRLLSDEARDRGKADLPGIARMIDLRLTTMLLLGYRPIEPILDAYTVRDGQPVFTGRGVRTVDSFDTARAAADLRGHVLAELRALGFGAAESEDAARSMTFEVPGPLGSRRFVADVLTKP